jgi:hypothetical protein
MDQSTTADNNVAVGVNALTSNTTGGDNTAVGFSALDACATGSNNAAVGLYAGKSTTSGSYNVMIGRNAMYTTTTGDENVAVGYNALYNHTTSNDNVCVGSNAGASVTSGVNNLLLGHESGRSTAPSGAVTTGNNVVCLGDNSITDLYCADTSISSSDERDKTDIEAFNHGLDWIKKLEPITYRWDKRAWYVDDPDTPQNEGVPDGSKKRERLHLGFRAQNVLAVEQEDGYASKKDDMLMVNLNEDETAYGMKYERLVVVLTNAVKELSAEVEQLKAQINN